MKFGYLDFNEKMEWPKWELKDFAATFAGQIAINCDESVEEIAVKLGVKMPPDKKPKGLPSD
jgi:hypothetical protein